MMKVLIGFSHGLGDAAQFTSVLRHLKKKHPDWEIDVFALRGKHSLLRLLCKRAWGIESRDQWDKFERGPAKHEYDAYFNLHWPENHAAIGHNLSTKAGKTLRDVFKIEPHKELWEYQIEPPAIADAAAKHYLENDLGLTPDANGKYRAACIHYEGNTSSDRKNLTHAEAEWLIHRLRMHNYKVVLFDWDRRSPLHDRDGVFCPGADHPIWGNTGTGDGATIAAIIQRCYLMLGIDSGPGHIAGGTDTETLIFWRQHHPIHFYNPCSNVVHVLPADHERYVRGDRGNALNWFFANHRTHGFRLDDSLDSLMGEPLRRWHMAETVLREKYGNEPITGIEVGVHRGHFSASLLRAMPNLHLTLLDPWSEADDDYRNTGDAIAAMTAEQHEACRRETVKLTLPFHQRCSAWRRRWEDVVDQLPNYSFDFVFLDANHSRNATEDAIQAFKSKVKPGGVMMGHDYGNRDYPGVKEAVDQNVHRFDPGLRVRTGYDTTWWYGV